MNSRKKREQADRSKIDLQQPHEVKHWTRLLGATREELRMTIEKVGSSAAAVRKELSGRADTQAGKAAPEMPSPAPNASPVRPHR